jgi:hypothetical protein
MQDFSGLVGWLAPAPLGEWFFVPAQKVQAFHARQQQGVRTVALRCTAADKPATRALSDPGSALQSSDVSQAVRKQARGSLHPKFSRRGFYVPSEIGLDAGSKDIVRSIYKGNNTYTHPTRSSIHASIPRPHPAPDDAENQDMVCPTAAPP